MESLTPNFRGGRYAQVGVGGELAFCSVIRRKFLARVCLLVFFQNSNDCASQFPQLLEILLHRRECTKLFQSFLGFASHRKTSKKPV